MRYDKHKPDCLPILIAGKIFEQTIIHFKVTVMNWKQIDTNSLLTLESSYLLISTESDYVAVTISLSIFLYPDLIGC